ncbi:MAG: hypothetical protein U0Q12_23610 [Vicinamibacterales bacterium]
MTLLITTQIVVAAIQIYLVWRLLKAFAILQRYDERLGHFGDALSLLTETTETGFVTMGQELERVATMLTRKDGPHASQTRPASRRKEELAVAATFGGEEELLARMQTAERAMRMRPSTVRSRPEKGDGSLRRQ